MKHKGKRSVTGANMMRIWLMLMLAFLGELLFYTWCRVQHTQVGYEISEGMRHQRRLFVLQENLKIELARLKSLDRIEAIARRELKLTRPKPEQVIVIP